jgi:hypothetical protein
MKAKDFIIIGGAIALFYLYQKNKTKKLVTTTDTTTLNEPTPSGESTSVVQEIVTGTKGQSAIKEVMITPVRNLDVVPTIPTPVTPITNPTLPSETPTEVAIQTGGVSTVLQPAIIPQPILSTEESLIVGNIRPIANVRPSISTSID